jgi:cyanophycinase
MAAKRRSRIGRLLVIGGAEDPDESNMKILPHFVKLCGGRRARIVVCGSPSNDPGQKERTYERLFRKIGVRSVVETGIIERHDAEDPALLRALEAATGVFFTGGDQLRLVSVIAGTPFEDCLQRRLWSDRLVVGGTSAGAAAMSSAMVIGGDSEGTVRRQDVMLAPGLSLMRDVLVDTHFAQRGRLSRILTIFSMNPDVLGIGIDENTAVEVAPGKSLTVLGHGAVFIFDGLVTHSNAAERKDKEVITITDSIVHVLGEGYGFDLKKLRPLRPNGKAIKARRS